MTKHPKRGRPFIGSEKRVGKCLTMHPKSWKALKAHKTAIKAKSLGLANEDAIARLSARHPLT